MELPPQLMHHIPSLCCDVSFILLHFSNPKIRGNFTEIAVGHIPNTIQTVVGFFSPFVVRFACIFVTDFLPVSSVLFDAGCVRTIT